MAEGGVLTGPEIHRCIKEGRIQVTPFDEQYINPGSIDLTLGSKVAVYGITVFVSMPGLVSPFKNAPMYTLTDDALRHTTRKAGTNLTTYNETLDSKKEQPVYTFDIDPTLGWVLQPGIGYLMHTAERVCTKEFVPVLDGKSSIGRLFVTAHVTAGYGDTGFDGQYTLEVTTKYPVRVYPGMRFCQMRFMTLSGEVMDYKKSGNYIGEHSMGPVPSRAWNQFDGKARNESNAGVSGLAQDAAKVLQSERQVVQKLRG